MLVGHNPQEITPSFDDQLRQRWPMAQVGFAVNLTGAILCPSPLARPETKIFCANYDQFLSCRQSAEVYWNGTANIAANSDLTDNANPKWALNSSSSQAPAESDNSLKSYKSRGPSLRSVSPQQQLQAPATKGQQADQMQSFSKIAASEAEFCQLIGAATDGMLARFREQTQVMFWHRRLQNPQYVFGAQLNLPASSKISNPPSPNPIHPSATKFASPCSMTTPGPSPSRIPVFAPPGSALSSPRKSARRCRIGKSPLYLARSRQNSRSPPTREITLGLSLRSSCSPSASAVGSSSPI